MTPTIIGFNDQTATIAIGLKQGCRTVDDTATLNMWESGCAKYVSTCIPAGCGLIKTVQTVVLPVKTSFPYVGKDSNSRAVFTIPASVKASKQLYWQGEMTMCGRTVKVQLQKSNSVSVSSVATSFVTGYVDYVVNGVVIGKVALISPSCLSIPKGWVAMKNPVDGALVGYAPLFKGDGFCKPYTQTAYGCSNVWLA